MAREPHIIRPRHEGSCVPPTGRSVDMCFGPGAMIRLRPLR
jgi:hypothetical protein